MSDERLDRVIDQVAREMTEGTLSGDFRARVVARIADNDGPRTNARYSPWQWSLAPLAAAALVVIAIFAARGARAPAPIVPQRPAPIAQAPAPQESPRIEPARAPRGGIRPEETRRAPQALAQRAIDASDVEALAPLPIVTPSIAIRTLTTDSLSLEELETPAPIAIAPLATPEGERP